MRGVGGSMAPYRSLGRTSKKPVPVKSREGIRD